MKFDPEIMGRTGGGAYKDRPENIFFAKVDRLENFGER